MKNILKKAVAKKAEKKPQEKPAERGYVEPRPCGCAPRTCASMLYALACAIILCGCAYKGAKVVEGTDLAVGVDIPAAEGVMKFTALNWLSGFRLGVDQNAILTVKYTSAETNSYLGIITTQTSKTIDATVEPCEKDAEEKPADETPAK